MAGFVDSVRNLLTSKYERDQDKKAAAKKKADAKKKAEAKRKKGKVKPGAVPLGSGLAQIAKEANTGRRRQLDKAEKDAGI
jgi:hypothetical protein